MGNKEEVVKENGIENSENKSSEVASTPQEIVCDEQKKEEPIVKEASEEEKTAEQVEGQDSSEVAKEDEKGKGKLKTSDKVFFIVTSSVILLLAIYLMLFSFVFFHVSVSGTSMDNTLKSGDILIANKLKTPDYGDVIIISGVKENRDWLVKRVIALEGDKVVIKDGQVYLNGELLVEEYAIGNTYAPDCRDDTNSYEITYTVGEGEIFFLGDNREDSLDSRFYGKCTIDNIEGVVGEFSIKIKGITTPVNRFFMKVKAFFGIKASIQQGKN